MMLDSQTVAQLSLLFPHKFKGRRDAYAVRRDQANFKGNHPYIPARTPGGSDIPLTPEVLARHIQHETTIGIYLFEAGGNTVHVGVFDLDDHDGSTSWEEMLAKSKALIRVLEQCGLQAGRFRSRGGHGIHVWVLFDAPVPAGTLRKLMQSILADVGLREGSDGGLAAGVCEIYPKQEMVAARGYGNLVALPLSGESAPIDSQGEILTCEQWLEFFQTVPVNSAGLIPPQPGTEKRPVGRPPSSATLDAHPLDACAFVQHSRDNAATLSEPLWFALAANCGVVDGGKALFHEISSRDSGRYDVGEAEAKISRAEEAKSPHCCATIGKEGFPCPHMKPSGECDIHGGRAPAVFALEPKARIKFIQRQEKVSQALKQELISKVVIDDLCRNGGFYRTRGDGRLLFFKKDEKRLYDLNAADFKALCNDVYGVNGSTPLWRYCIEDVVTHCARRGAVTETFLFARWAGGKLYIDKGNQEVFRLDGRVTEIVSNGTDGILFEDSGVEPIAISEQIEGSPLRALLVDGLNTKEVAFKDLLVAYIYGLFFESLQPTKPLLLMNGVKGSGKTSALRAKKKALFGEHADVSRGFTKSEGDAIAAITHNHFLIADNVDGMVPWLGDLIASISTGTEISLRTLYKTNDLSTYKPRCFVGITSRDPVSFKRDDLTDRLFMIDLERRKEFIAESELHRRIQVQRGDIWCELLSNLNKIIARINDNGLPTTSNHRLADWARLVTVIGEVLELPQVQEGLDLLAQTRSEFALEGNAIYDGIQAWVSNGYWKDGYGEARRVSTGQLHEEISALYSAGNGYGRLAGI